MQNKKRPLWMYARKLKVNTQLFLFLVITITGVSLPVLFFGRYCTVRIFDRYINHYLQSEQRLMADNLGMYLEEVIMVSLRFKNMKEIYQILDRDDLDRPQKETALLEAASGTRLPSSNFIAAAYLVDSDSNIYLLTGSQGLPLPDIKTLNQDAADPYYDVGTVFSDATGHTYIPVSMRFYNYHTFQDIGFLVLYLSQDALALTFDETLPALGETFLINEDGLILSHRNPAQIGQPVQDLDIRLLGNSFSVQEIQIEGRNFAAASIPLGQNMLQIGFPWRLVSIIPHSNLYEAMNRLLWLLLAAALLSIAAASLLSLRLSSRLTRSIQNLSSRIRSLSEGRLDSFLAQTPRDELWDLEQGYNEMVIRINELLEKNKLEQIKKRELEFTALQAQINPHFLYNTLDTIGWIATLKGQPEIEQMVMELSRFFRLSLHKGDQFIPLEDELGIVSSYLKIEQLRNPGKFDVSYDISPELNTLLVPKIILQPIVENAVKHGISQVNRHGSIHIHGCHVDDDVYLTVSDNGAGIKTGPVADDAKTDPLPGTGYGLRNIQERIQLEYGASYGLSVDSRPDLGTTVTLHICF